MSEIIKFRPNAELDAEENVKQFIILCRDQLTIFGEDLDWETNVWDVTKWNYRPGRKGRIALTFSNYDTSKQKVGDMMSQPFLDFAKAYMRYQHSMRPTKDMAKRMDALKALERALLIFDDIPKVEMTDPEVLNRASQLIKKKFASSTAYRVGSQLEMLSDFLSENQMTEIPFTWKNPIKRQKDTFMVGKKAEERRAEKLPSEAALDALPKAFHIATETKDILTTSIIAILCSAPDRISEVWRLPVNCEIFEKRPKGGEAYGLRWWPSKGAAPMPKWIVGTMADVVKKAISNIRRETQEARNIALWYEDHPDQVYLPPDCEHLRNNPWLSTSDIQKIVGFANSGSAYNFCVGNKLSHTTIKGRNYYRFQDFEKIILGMLPEGFPIMNPETGMKYSEALLLIQRNTFHPDKATYRCMFDIITTDTVNNQLGAGIEHGKSSLFSRLGFTEPDGSPIVVTSHQFRHWLNTLAKKGGLSELDIAKWAGRTDIRHNDAYDHRTPLDMVEKIRSIGSQNMTGEIAQLAEKAPMSREEYLKLIFPTAHVTPIGFCINDWTMMPCQVFGDHINCQQHIYIKGMEEKTQRIEQNLIDAEEQLERATKAIDDGKYGADRWFKAHQRTTERLRSLLGLLRDPNIPEGSVIQLSIEDGFSPFVIAMDERKKIDSSDADILARIKARSKTQNKQLPQPGKSLALKTDKPVSASGTMNDPVSTHTQKSTNKKSVRNNSENTDDDMLQRLKELAEKDTKSGTPSKRKNDKPNTDTNKSKSTVNKKSSESLPQKPTIKLRKKKDNASGKTKEPGETKAHKKSDNQDVMMQRLKDLAAKYNTKK